jgi:hypothetical protein
MRIVRHGDIVVPLMLGWTDGTQIVLLKEPAANFRANVVVSSEDLGPGETLEDFRARTRTSLRETLTALRVDYEGHTTLGPWNGYMVEHRFEANNNVLKQIQFHIHLGAKVHTLTCTHVESEFEDTRLEFQQIISELQINL